MNKEQENEYYPMITCLLVVGLPPVEEENREAREQMEEKNYQLRLNQFLESNNVYQLPEGEYRDLVTDTIYILHDDFAIKKGYPAVETLSLKEHAKMIYDKYWDYQNIEEVINDLTPPEFLITRNKFIRIEKITNLLEE